MGKEAIKEMNKKLILIVTLVVSLSLISSMFGRTTIKATTLTGRLDVEKKVWNGLHWVNSIDANIGDTVQFKITLTYYNLTGGAHYAYNIMVNDTLPSCLEYDTGSACPFEPSINGNLLTWDLDTTILYDTEVYEITFNATVVDCGENVNAVEATADEHCTGQVLSDQDTATVNVACPEPGIDVKKWVWDGTCEWVDDTWVYPGDTVRFKIVVMNTGETILENVTAIDTLSDSLEYADDATVDGVPIEPTITGGGKILTWDLGTLAVNQTVVIEFNANVSGLPCSEDINLVEVTAEVECGEDISDSDTATVHINGMCMEKEVWDDKVYGWMEETTIGQGEEVRFRIRVMYHGDYKLYDMKIWDVLPSCLDYADKATVNGDPYEPESSSDGKTLWWNLTSEYVLYDSQTLVIEFTAYAGNSNCEPCINWAYIRAKECSGSIFEWEDPATVNIECAFVADAGGPYSGEVGETITITGSATGGSLPYTYKWDMDNDGSYDDVTGKTVTWSWSEEGIYIINLKVTDDDGDKAYDYASVTIEGGNEAPVKPDRPSGMSVVRAGEKTLYFASTTDPDGDDIYYKFSWGDGTDSGWVGPFPSGTLADANHTWSARGDYTIKVKAKDTHGLETDWSDPLPIRVPKGREMFNHPLLLKILNRLIELFPLLKNLILN